MRNINTFQDIHYGGLFVFESFSRTIPPDRECESVSTEIQGSGVRIGATRERLSRARIPFEFRDGGDLLENKALLFVR